MPPGSPPNHGGFGVPDGQSIPAYEPNAVPSHSGQMNHRGGGGAPPPPGGFGGGGGFDSTGGVGGGFPSIPPGPKSLARVGLGAYGDKFLGSVSSNYAKYVSSSQMRQYFDVSEPYVLNKLKLVFCPFLHKGSWARIPEQSPGGLAFKPPRNDINAPDLYVPLMGFWSYVVAASTLQVRRGEFTPEGVAVHAWWGAVFWAGAAIFLWMALRSMSTAHVRVGAPLLDVVAYAGYAFPLSAFAVWTKIILAGWSWAPTAATAWGALSGAVFVVKTTKRIIFSEARHRGVDGNTHNYLLLALAGAQFPLHFALAGV